MARLTDAKATTAARARSKADPFGMTTRKAKGKNKYRDSELRSE
jgi:hypothetical protein